MNGIPDLIDVIELLTERTREKNVNWIEIQPPDKGYGRRFFGSYMLNVDGNKLVISKTSPNTEADFFQVTVENEKGRVVLDETIDDGSAGYRQLNDLLSAINRIYNNPDDAIEKFRSALLSKKTIGDRALETVSSNPNDIPF